MFQLCYLSKLNHYIKYRFLLRITSAEEIRISPVPVKSTWATAPNPVPFQIGFC
jgi:hypothetical protein